MSSAPIDVSPTKRTMSTAPAKRDRKINFNNVEMEVLSTILMKHSKTINSKFLPLITQIKNCRRHVQFAEESRHRPDFQLKDGSLAQYIFYSLLLLLRVDSRLRFLDLLREMFVGDHPWTSLQ